MRDGAPRDKRDGPPRPPREPREAREPREPREPRESRDARERHDRAQSEPPVAGLAPRQAALDILSLIAKQRTLDDALEDCRSFNALEGADRGLARALASTVLRRRGSIDHLIGRYLTRPLPKKSARAMDILRLACAQLTILKTPDHAAVSTSVALAKAFQETQGYAGLINAIARKLATTAPDALDSLPARVDTPGWLWRAWERHYGAALTRRIALAHRSEAPLDLTVRAADTATALADQLGGTVIGAQTIRLDTRASVTALAGFETGAFWVQDYAASLPARLLPAGPDTHVLDLCAAPGGKTMQLAATGASVTAVDQSGHRLARVQENLSRTGLKANTVKADILTFAPNERYDAILLDAPCTATGTIRRHPDIPWSKSEDDVAALGKIQGEMLDKAIGWLKPGGTLVYCVCSLQPAEGHEQIERLLASHEAFERVPITPGEVDGREPLITRAGDLRTLPAFDSDIGGMDGFFAARIRRKPGV